jgi:hypothetical protein
MEGLEAALASLQLSESINYAATARKFKCDETTLRRRHQSKQQLRQNADFSYKTHLLKQQEKDHVAYVNKLTAHGLPPTLAMVKNFAEDLAKNEVGKNSPYEFVKRHNNELSSGWLKGEDLARKKADDTWRYEAYFELVSKESFVGFRD